MQKYDIRRLTNNRRRLDTVTLPAIHESVGGRKEYLKALRRMLKELRSAANQTRTEHDFTRLAELSVGLTATSDNMVRRILGLESKRHTETFMRTARRALGVDLRQVIRDDDLTDYLNNAALRNSALIKNLGDDTVNRVSQAVIGATIDGKSATKLQEQLVKDFGILDNRAKFIAQDQMAKLNSDLNRIRHEQAGITEYIWATSRDERVRSLHRSLDRTQYKYGEPTGAEGGQGPGKPVRCRCVARGVVEF